MKTLGQIAYETRNPEGPNWQSTGDLVQRDYERLADVVAAEAIKREQLAADERMAKTSGESLGTTAFAGFYRLANPHVDWENITESDRRYWNAAALAVKARVLAEMEANVVSDAKRAAGHEPASQRSKDAADAALEEISERQRRKDADDELDRLRVQLAGCLTAAEGGTKDVARNGDYGWSPAYQAVVDLRMQFDRIRQPTAGHGDVPTIEEIKSQLKEYGSRNVFPFIPVECIKPEPSLLEVAAIVCRNGYAADIAVRLASELIAAVRDHEKAGVK